MDDLVQLNPKLEKGIAPRRLTVLGATGSIGRSTAQVLRDGAPGRFEVEAVVGGRDALALAAIAREFRARHAVIADENALPDLRAALAGSGVEAAAGHSAILEAASRPADIIVGAITGAAGVEPTFAALGQGRSIALANKETLVCAGEPFMRAAEASGARILPMDSEHNAIFQALGGASPSTIEKMILTASGGPFRLWTREAIAAATPEQALLHPNWQMGPKVTIDSAGLMNKGLELIEAHHLFAVPADRLDVLVHPQSIVHGLVSFSDGALVAGLSHPDMKVPIAHCLGWPDRLPTSARRLDLAEVGSLTFEKPDYARFPALEVAMDALREGGVMPTVLNAANEIAVEEFLNRRIDFSGIASIVRRVCNEFAREANARRITSVADALAVDHIARERTRTILARGRGSA
jgi:1-deoxy-D-xylulose-5-phosphate reductoisomerase